MKHPLKVRFMTILAKDWTMILQTLSAWKHKNPGKVGCMTFPGSRGYLIILSAMLEAEIETLYGMSEGTYGYEIHAGFAIAP